MAKYITDREFKRLVRVCLDQNMSSEALSDLGDVDTLSLDEIIDSKAEDAALTIVRMAPIDKLGDVAQSLEGTLDIDEGEPHKAVIQLPLDFERLVRFKMSGWKYAVYAALPPLPPQYIEANSEFGVCGTKDRPLVFLVPSTGNGKDLCLEIFSAKDVSDTLDGCLYVARPRKRSVESESGGENPGGENPGGENPGENDFDDEGAITCSEASEIGYALNPNHSTEETYSVVGYITEVVGGVSDGRQSFWMADTTEGNPHTITATNAILPEGEEAFEVGMRVLVTGRLNKSDDDIGYGVVGINEGTVSIDKRNPGDNSGESNPGGDNPGEDEDEVPEYVDLGLPSGTLWATKNVGASKPEEYGDYFSWGETEPKESYGWPDYSLCDGSITTINKYTYSDGASQGDGLKVLEPEDDAATSKWGSSWQMPSVKQITELKTSTNSEWTSRGGVNGLLLTSKYNGASIFFPASGEIVGDEVEGAGEYGKYWTRYLNSGTNTKIYDAYSFSFPDGTPVHVTRQTGLCVRPVVYSTPTGPWGSNKKPNIYDEPDAGVADTVEIGDAWRMLLGERLLMPTVYYAAYLTALAVRDNNAAESLLVVAKSLVEG